jgi:glycosyltransferase involved in cell wall biosynthesis
VRVCIAYDCLFPWTVGGAERWYRALAERLVAEGHEVTYLTRRQWEEGSEPAIAGVRVVAVSPSDPLYDEEGRRRIAPPLRFGRGVLAHLLRHRRAYDAVHLCSFPFFSLLAARAALVRSGTTLTVDWFEVWSLGYWQGYLGRAGGLVGWLVQRLCALLTPRAFVFSALHERRLRAEGYRGSLVRLRGLWGGDPDEVPASRAAAQPPFAVFAGRHIPEKRAATIPAAIAAARASVPELRARILGDGPEREAVRAEVARLGLGEVVDVPGFVEAEELAEAMATATCLVLPSVREGYGLVVVEAARVGTPSVVVQHPDNAAVELVERGVNGAVARDGSPEALAEAIVAAHAGGVPLRASTSLWFSQHARELSVDGSLDAVLAAYGGSPRVSVR